MARVLDPATGTDVTHCVSCGVDMDAEGVTCFNARDLCIDCCGEHH